MNKNSFSFSLSLLIVLVLVSGILKGQSASRENFNFVFENNFQDDQVGRYLHSDYITDWNLNSASTMHDKEIVDIKDLDEKGYDKFMRGYFPKGTYLPDNQGWLWKSYLSKGYEELYFSYDIKFREGFNWVQGGKIPGLTGGPIISGTKAKTTDGFSARMMWKQNGKLVFYVYHQDMEIDFGSSYPWGTFCFTAGKWYNLTIRVVVNTVTNSVGERNGILEGFVNGKLMFQKTDIKFRSMADFKIDNLYICAFFGGGTDSWAAARDEWIDTDNYVAYTYSTKATNVPRGRVKSSWEKILLHPYYNFSSKQLTPNYNIDFVNEQTDKVIPSTDEYSYSSSMTDAISGNGSKILLKPGQNVYFRTKASSSLSASDIQTLNVPARPAAPNFAYDAINQRTTTTVSSAFEYADNSSMSNATQGTGTYVNIIPGTTKYFRIKASSTAFKSNIQTLATLKLTLAAPSSFSNTLQSKSSLTFKWLDNASDEQGYKLYRSISATEGFTEIASLGANTITYTDASLQPLTSYYYKLRAFNQNGYSEYTPVLKATTTQLDLPSTPSMLTCTGQTNTTLSLNWKDNSTRETGHEIYRSTSSSGNYVAINKVGANVTAFTDNMLEPGTTYYYKLRAFSQDGYSDYTSVLEAATTGITIIDSTHNANTAPVIENQEYTVQESSFSDNFVGKIVAKDPDGDKLKYSIVSGDESGMFILDNATGNLKTSTDKVFGPGTFSYDLTVKVEDDATSSESTVAKIRITFVGLSKSVYINPENIGDVFENGSLYHPFDSWQDVTWKEGYSYLQKRGTTATMDKILIGSDNVILGAYGEGELPVIQSESNTYLIVGYEKSNVRIQNLKLQAEHAISSIYFLSSPDDSIFVEHCIMTGMNNALKIVNAKYFISKYNTIYCKNEGIYSSAVTNDIYYNVFKDCSSAISVTSNQSTAYIYNNVFVNNAEAISISYADLTIYNNIFYMLSSGQKAIRQGSGTLTSDYNIFFPEQVGFINIANKNFDDLRYLQSTLNIDLNSFTLDPEFVNIYNDNFSLKSNSPAINKGKNLNIQKDLMGIKVPFASITDIGVTEYTGKIFDNATGKELISPVHLFPNPSVGQVNILAELPPVNLSDAYTNGTTEIKVVDSYGRPVFSKLVDINGSSINESVDLSEISNGLYFVIFKIADKIFKEKLIISK